MKKQSLAILVAFCAVFSLFSQEKTKQGFGFGALPAVSFDSDLGFQYGAIVNLFDYGDGSRFPRYDHSLYLEWSRYTKGSGIARIRYDSDRLLPNIRTTFDVSYLTDQAMDFFGFNGRQSIFHPDFLDNPHTQFFYKYDQRMFRAKADFQGGFGQSDFGWIAGYTFYNFRLRDVQWEKLDAIEQPTLFQHYIDCGLIRENEAAGGNINYFKLGLQYDSRDQLSFPTRGIWTEAVVETAPGFANQLPHTKFALIHRQYFSIIPDRMVFAYRIHYQTTVGNQHAPFFIQPMLTTSFLTASRAEGLGGRTSIRGVLRNRVVGDGFALGNFECRYKFLKFSWLNQNFYLGTNVFFDTGVILKPIKMEIPLIYPTSPEETLVPRPPLPNYYHFNDFKKGQFHSAIGAGLKIGWNENFVISVDFGKALNEQDGNTGFYIGLNYLF
jgi:hypothetical protein